MRHRGESGYTLVELGVVLGVIAVLIAVSAPVLLGARTRGHDGETRSTLRDGIVAAHVFHSDGDTYTGFGVAAAEAVEPSITWAEDQAGFNAVVIIEAEGDLLQLVSASESGTYFCIRDTQSSTAVTPVTYGSGPTFDSVDEPSECDAAVW